MDTIGSQLTFWTMAALTVGSGVLAATHKKIVNAAFSLMATFFGVAGIYAVLGSDFLAITQAVVYIGGILILLVFGVLLTDRVPDEYRVTKSSTMLSAGFAGGLTFLALGWAAAGTEWPAMTGALDGTESTVHDIGVSLLTDYLIPFEFASVLLLVVLVGSARMARGGTR
jgi:NADH:ubiquinone oxidoreductase subunit 6 (subunit J)